MTEPAGRADLPTGTITFLRTDVEGSMRLAIAIGSAWDELNDAQMGLIREAVGSQGGGVVRTEGDAVFAVFREAVPAALAAIDIQRRIAGHPWPPEAPVRVRVGIHTGEAHLAGDDYGGFDVNRAARISAVGHGGQIVLSDPTRGLVATELPSDVTIRDLGRHALKDVPQVEHLFQLDAPGLGTSFPPLRTSAPTLGNLPARLTSFLGREAELDTIAGLFDESRLLTILGPGGIGKTSLAIEAARQQASAAPDGAWFVALDPISDATLVQAAIARTLGIYDGPGRPVSEGVAHFLADRRTLLVLDNFEQVLGAAPLVPQLLRDAPELRVLVTSRAPLRVAGEQVVPVEPLDDVGPDAAAVRLFTERARSAVPGWSAGDEAPIVEEICQLLDGLPLGIELAAARVGLLPPSVIRDRLAARLPLPGAGPRDLPARQRTLEDAIGWSYELLPPARQRLLRELSVFDGGFDVEQARAVATPGGPDEDVLDSLIELADQSLVDRDRVTSTSGLGSMRFHLLETIRSVGLRLLRDAGEEADVRDRHAAAFADLAERAGRHWLTADQPRWLDRIGEDHANVRAAVEWTIEHGPIRRAQQLAANLWRYWQLGGHLWEGRLIVDRIVELAPDEPSTDRLWALGAAGGIAYWQADTAVAAARYEEQLVVARQIGDRAGEADAHFNLASTNFIVGERGASRASLMAARAIYEELGDTIGSARTRWGEHNVLVYEDRADLATPILEELTTTYVQNGDVMYQALTAGSMAFINLLANNIPVAMGWAAKSMAMYYAMRDAATATITLAACAVALVETGHPADAATLLGAYDGLTERFGVKPPAGIEYVIGKFHSFEHASEAMHADEYAAAHAAGLRMNLDETVAFALDALERAATSGAETDAQSRTE